jgi:F0F1-type ATP synthase membrane subunit b/b'
METLIFPFINLTALLVLLAIYLRKPLADYVVTRHQTVSDELVTARDALVTAKKQIEDFNSRLKGMDTELASLRAQAREDGEKSKSTILSSATKLSSTILADAKVSANSLQSEFRVSLRRELASLALARAEVRLRDRLTGEDQARIRQEFSTLVEKTQ